jgi:hypothetical protein
MEGMAAQVMGRALTLVWVLAVFGLSAAGELTYPVVDTGQESCYDERGRVIACPPVGDDLSGQDAQHVGNQPSYRDNGDGTVSDLVTGLMWQKVPTGGVSWDEAVLNPRPLHASDVSREQAPATELSRDELLQALELKARQSLGPAGNCA